MGRKFSFSRFFHKNIEETKIFHFFPYLFSKILKMFAVLLHEGGGSPGKLSFSAIGGVQNCLREGECGLEGQPMGIPPFPLPSPTYGTVVHTHHGCRHRRSPRPRAASRRPLLEKRRELGAPLYPASVWSGREFATSMKMGREKTGCGSRFWRISCLCRPAVAVLSRGSKTSLLVKVWATANSVFGGR